MSVNANVGLHSMARRAILCHDKTMNMKYLLAFLALCITSVTAFAADNPIASTPPMGWNSWDAYGESIDEQQVRATAEKMSSALKAFGWQYVVIDEGWYLLDIDKRTKPEASKFSMNADGQFIPDPVRYPSSANGAGLKPLADYIHSLGLKFGIHILRGIPREAVDKNLPVAGSNFKTTDSADTSAVCPWNNYNYGVKSAPAGAAYYDSIIKLYASWGVDFVKVDCIADHPFSPDDIRMLAEAIKKTGRPIVLSLSPGPTQREHYDFIKQYANMWRISNDFWDHWDLWKGNEWSESLKQEFDTTAKWARHTGPGAWADADMLPLGYLGPHPGMFEARQTHLTRGEQRAVMTLWAISRSPLMMGGDLLSLDDWTKSLLTNPEVIAVDQHSTDNRPVFRKDDIVVWTARPQTGRGYYVAIFNLADKEQEATASWDELGLTAGPFAARDLWSRRNIGTTPSLKIALAPHASVLWLVR
jgi:alpha-galactosidase